MQKLWQSFEYYLLRRFRRLRPWQHPLTTRLQNLLTSTKPFSKHLATLLLHKAHLEREYDIMLEVCKQFHLKTSLTELKTDYSA